MSLLRPCDPLRLASEPPPTLEQPRGCRLSADQKMRLKEFELSTLNVVCVVHELTPSQRALFLGRPAEAPPLSQQGTCRDERITSQVTRGLGCIHPS